MKLPTRILAPIFALAILQFSCSKDDPFIRKADQPADSTMVHPPVDTTKPPPVVVPPVVVPPAEIIETRPAILTAVTTNINGNCAGFYKGLPARYDSTDIRYPLIVFIHGLGELGNGASDLGKVLNNGTPRLMKNKTFPANFVSDGKNYAFALVAPQFKNWPSAADVNAVVDYAVANLRVDPTRIYVVGLSMGGGATWTFAGSYPSKAAAVAPICGAQGASTQEASKISTAKLAVWAFHNNDDPTVEVAHTNNWISYINNTNPVVPARKTIWPTGGHDAWTKACDPSYKESNKNLYEWLLQYHR